VPGVVSSPAWGGIHPTIHSELISPHILRCSVDLGATYGSLLCFLKTALIVPRDVHWAVIRCLYRSAASVRGAGVSNLGSALQAFATATSHIQECVSIAPLIGNDPDIVSALNALETLTEIFRRFLPEPQPQLEETKADVPASVTGELG
jgi:hypothetical protein